MKIRDARKMAAMVLMAVTVIGCLVKISAGNQTISVWNSDAEDKERGWVVVVDAGHGGFDPGKVGIGERKEKDINLQIALYVKAYLEAEDITVVMTRETDDAGESKSADMKKRVALIEETAPNLTVSIHQNSYPEEYVKGAQVFYYENSDEGERLADSIQRSIVKRVDARNKRKIKANSSYYMLKYVKAPIVITECGFLTNVEEAQKLGESGYQKRIAWAIAKGVREYLEDCD